MRPIAHLPFRRSTPVPFASTSCSVPSSQSLRLLKRKSMLHAAMLMFWISSNHYLSMSPVKSNHTCTEVTISGFDTEVGGKGSQLSGGQKRMLPKIRVSLRDTYSLSRAHCNSPCPTPQ